MNQKEKMINGELYDSTDVQLVLDRDRASRILNKYNKKCFHEYNMKNGLMKKLLNTTGKFWIKPPFHCDYGYNIYIGENVFLNYGCTLLDVCKITIGDNTLLGPNVQIYTAGHPVDPAERLKGLEFGKEISIGNNVWIGGSSIICPGVTIGDNTVIGAGSVVTKSIPENVVAFGNPCTVRKNL